jgi:hypothetical protein
VSQIRALEFFNEMEQDSYLHETEEVITYENHPGWKTVAYNDCCSFVAFKDFRPDGTLHSVGLVNINEWGYCIENFLLDEMTPQDRKEWEEIHHRKGCLISGYPRGKNELKELNKKLGSLEDKYISTYIQRRSDEF